jgi:hypothetical protein
MTKIYGKRKQKLISTLVEQAKIYIDGGYSIGEAISIVISSTVYFIQYGEIESKLHNLKEAYGTIFKK